MGPRERDLDALLGASVEPLPPPPGTWDEIRSRASRLRTTRRAATVLAAAAAVTAVLVPVALIVGSSGGAGHRAATTGAGQPRHVAHQRTSGWPTPDTTTYSPWRPASTLRGLEPASISFVTQTEGYLLGTVAGSARLARTIDSGDSWSPVSIPAGFTVEGATGLGGVRFATGHVGFLFGSSLWMTSDSGLSWKHLAAPGPITDLEVAGGDHGRLWALVRQCPTTGVTATSTPTACNSERLYTAPVNAPRLTPVLDVTALPDRAAQLSLTAAGTGVFVLANRRNGEPLRFWSTDGGRTWQGDTGPCMHQGTVAALIPNEEAVLCSRPGRRGDRARALLVLDQLSRRKDHQRIDVAAPPVGDLAGLTANNAGAVVLADGFSAGQRSHAPFQVSTDAGRSWQPGGPRLAGGAAFVGFISPARVVALSAPQAHAFLASNDGGLSWRVTDFAR